MAKVGEMIVRSALLRKEYALVRMPLVVYASLTKKISDFLPFRESK